MTDEAHDGRGPAPTLFSQLVVMLATSTLQQMGKLINPMTGKTDKNLEAAEATIDLLDMLQQKTEGNLDFDEKRLMDETLASLKLNYVETVNDAKEEQTEEQAEDQPAEDEPAEEPPKVESTGDPDKDDKEPKFHKTYE